MKIKLSQEQYFINSNNEFDIKKALIVIGKKAGVCYKQSEKSFDCNETESVLIKRAVNTILMDHVTPSQQIPISLEIENIPKIICMYLENIAMQSADEKSLRYTKLDVENNCSLCELELYNKWLNIFKKILKEKYYEYFLGASKNNEKLAENQIAKIAQENARYFINIFTLTNLSITSNLAELNKVALEMERTIKCSSNTSLENECKEYLSEFIRSLKDLKIIISNADIHDIDSEVACKLNIPNNPEMLYKNPKNIELNLFANKNKFSSIDFPSEYGSTFSINSDISFAGFAQALRHRTIRTEMKVPEEFSFYIPKLIEDDENLKNMWINDSLKVKDSYPQGQIIRVNTSGTLSDLVNYFGSERACNKAQLEISRYYMNLLKEYYEHLKEKNHPMQRVLEKYTDKYRCQNGCYKCISPCYKGPNKDRDF